MEVTFKWTGYDQPIVDCTIRYNAGRWRGVGDPPSGVFKCLLDTGATHCVLSHKVVEQLGLPLGTVRQHTVVGGEVRLCLGYVCDIILTDGKHALTVNDVDAIQDHLVGYDAIIGMNAMSVLDFTFRRDRSVLIHK